MRQTGRLMTATVMLGIGFGVGGRAEAGGIALSTPAGLTPGESFRFAFITDGTTDATSTNIADYNNFVNAQRRCHIQWLQWLSWVAIGSTSTVNAIDNVGQTLTPVYLADGTLVTSSTTTSGLWSTTLQNPINEDLSGAHISNFVWTGTETDGLASVAFYLGGPGGAVVGNSALADQEWVSEAEGSPPSLQSPLYGISQVLTVQGTVPEPSTLLMAGMAISAGCAFGCSRGRRDLRR